MTEEINNKIKHLIETHPVTLFMKGTATAPQCGFSAQVVQILNELGADFHCVDVLADWDLREGIKEYTNWPTIPQLYIKGEFVGGCDIIMKLQRDAQLHALLPQSQ